MSGAQPSPSKLTAVDTNSAEWERLPLPEIGAVLDRLPLIADPDTGMDVLKVVYKAGFTNPWHTHNCAHAVYVLDGTLTAHQGNYPAGTFVRFPEGGTMTHGATDNDCTSLFITNKPFDIQYVGD
jgi:quercetin dioxygenase-like cupin family protein